MESLSKPSSMRAAWWMTLQAGARRYFCLLQKWWWVVLLATTGGAFLGSWTAWRQPTVYVSSGRMMVGGHVTLPENVSYNEEFANFFGTQVELMQSPEVRRRAADRVQAGDPGIEPCSVQVVVQQLAHTSLFVFQATGAQPAYTQKILNAVMEEYIAIKREMRSERSENTASAIGDQMLRVDREIRADEEALLQFQKKNNVGFMQEESGSASQYLVSLKSKLADLQGEKQLLDLLDIDQNIDRNAGAASPLSLDEAKLSGAGPEVEYLRARQQLALLEAQIVEQGKSLRPKHPMMVQLAQDVAQQKTVIETLRKQSGDRIKSRRKSIDLQIQTTQKSIDEWEKKALALNEKLSDYNRIKTRLDRSKSIYDQLIMNRNNISVSRGIDQDMVSVLERGTPAFPRKPHVARGLAAGGGIGLIASLAFLFLLNRLDDRMNAMHEFRAQFAEKVIGQIPSAEGEKDAKLLVHSDQRHAFAEAFRALRSSIFYMPFEGKAPKTLFVTSAVPGEGKSTIASNLAITIAFSGSRVLLVDGDLRRGALHARFGVENKCGFTDVLTNDSSALRATRATSIPNLFLIPRGSSVEHPGELYLGRGMELFLKEVYEEYDYVIFDSSPVMVADDSTSLAPKIDATLFVVRFGCSSARRCRDSLEMLHTRQANVIGVVCNAVEDLRQDYYGYAEYYTPAKT